jgi:hypothetical protein
VSAQTLLDFFSQGPGVAIGVAVLLVLLCVLIAYDGNHIRADR